VNYENLPAFAAEIARSCPYPETQVHVWIEPDEVVAGCQ
jgi:hypothetical protein